MAAGEPVRDLAGVLSEDGWAYASSAPVEPGDLGRFNALFGRDSLITALQLLPVRPDVARATLRALAALQGTTEDPETDEEPGKIIHEYRPGPVPPFVSALLPVRDGQVRYYGSADATSWFLVVLARLGDAALSAELSGAWRAAAAWLEGAIERGSGLVRYGPLRTPLGLPQQGWRDTSDPTGPDGSGIVRADGTAPTAPLADADCQAVAVAALRAAAVLSGDARWTEAAAGLRERVACAFDPDTMAVEADGRRVAGAGSQLGWLLWADALPPQAATAAADRLCGPDVLTPYGLRTLSERHPAFAAASYHRGSVWPFDSWIGWGGLRAAGREREAERVRTGVLSALDALGRAPELYAVTAGGPQPAALANQLQAWTVGARWALEQRWDGRAA